MSGAPKSAADATAASSAFMFQSAPAASMPTEEITGVKPASSRAWRRRFAAESPGSITPTRPKRGSAGTTRPMPASVAQSPRGISPALCAAPRSFRLQVPAKAPAITGMSSSGLTRSPSILSIGRSRPRMRASTSTPPPCTSTTLVRSAFAAEPASAAKSASSALSAVKALPESFTTSTSALNGFVIALFPRGQSSPCVSGKPKRRFITCTACPAAPLIRLSIAETTTA